MAADRPRWSVRPTSLNASSRVARLEAISGPKTLQQAAGQLLQVPPERLPAVLTAMGIARLEAIIAAMDSRQLDEFIQLAEQAAKVRGFESVEAMQQAFAVEGADRAEEHRESEKGQPLRSTPGTQANDHPAHSATTVDGVGRHHRPLTRSGGGTKAMTGT